MAASLPTGGCTVEALRPEVFGIVLDEEAAEKPSAVDISMVAEAGVGGVDQAVEPETAAEEILKT